jgi:ZIP family zinc transporter
MLVILIAFATLVATLLGGLIALKVSDKLKLVLGFSAGAVLAVALFDLLPESLSLTSNHGNYLATTLLVATGFFIYMLLDRLMVVHCHDDENCANENHRGKLGPGSLSIHSFLDGLGIGLAFKVSAAVGLVVAAGVLTHDFSDGINTVNMALRNKQTRKQAFSWLIADAVAPVLGVLVTLFFSVSEHSLGLILAVFCGFFLYIGASDLIPESHRQHPKIFTTIMTLLGMAVIYLAIRAAG